MKTVDDDIKWEIEVWFYKSYSSDVFELDRSMDSMTSQQKNDILKIKQQRAINKKTKNELSSVDIYKGVILEGKKDLCEY